MKDLVYVEIEVKDPGDTSSQNTSEMCICIICHRVVVYLRSVPVFLQKLSIKKPPSICCDKSVSQPVVVFDYTNCELSEQK